MADDARGATVTPSRITNILRIAFYTLWPPQPELTPAAIHYYESVLEESK